MAKTRIYTTGLFRKRRFPKGSSGEPKKGPRGPGRRGDWSRDDNRFGLLGVVLVACAVLAVLPVLDGLITRGEIYRGVEVAGVDVGGKTPEEARQVLRERLSDEAPKEITLSGAGESITLGTGDLGTNFDLASTVERANDVGRTGGLFERLSERLRATFGTVQVGAETGYDTELVRNVVGDLAQQVNREGRNATVTLSGTQATAEGGQEGYRLDQPATRQNLRQAVGNLDNEARIAGSPVEPEISSAEAGDAAAKVNVALEKSLVFESGDQTWELSPEQSAQILAVENAGSGVELGINGQQLRDQLPQMYEDLQTKPKDANFVFVNGSVDVEAARPGKQVAEDKLVENLRGGLFDGQSNFEVPLKDGGQPELTTEKAESMKPTELLGKFETNYEKVKDPDGNRTYNLEIASEAINKTILAPGEVFSVNDTVSQLDYKEAKVFQEGLIQYAEGGGLCQVASTMYVAATRAGLDIVERHQHYAMLEYIKPGFDSTVWFGDAYGNGELDSRFKNNTDSYVLLREWVDEDGNMYAEVWGQPHDRTAELRSEEVDRTNSSSTWVTYKTVKENGEVVEEGRAYEDVYRSLGANELNDNPYGFDPFWHTVE